MQAFMPPFSRVRLHPQECSSRLCRSAVVLRPFRHDSSQPSDGDLSPGTPACRALT